MKRHRCIRLVLQGRHVRPRLVLESIVQKSRSCCNAGEKFEAEMIRSGMIRSILDDSIWTFFYKITDLFHSHIKTSTARFFENINCKTSPLEWWFNVTISVWCKGDSRNFFGSKRRELRIELNWSLRIESEARNKGEEKSNLRNHSFWCLFEMNDNMHGSRRRPVVTNPRPSLNSSIIYLSEFYRSSIHRSESLAVLKAFSHEPPTNHYRAYPTTAEQRSGSCIEYE